MLDRVLIVDDDQAVRASLRRYLQRHGFEVDEADSCRSAEDHFRTFAPRVALIDYRLPDGEAIALLPRLRHIDPACTLFVLTGHGSINLAVRAVREGAAEFLTKPIDMPALLKAVQIGVRASRAGLARTSLVEPLFGDSAPMQALKRDVERLRTSTEAALFVGDLGTGRSTMARWVHATSTRASSTFVELSCATAAAERELFGHEAADGNVRPGVLEAADGGTLYLADLDHASPGLARRLLGFLVTGRFRRVGAAPSERAVDARVFASATAMLTDGESPAEDGPTLADFFRARSVWVPRLRERPEDILPLARHLLALLATRHGRSRLELLPDAEEALLQFPWPGNVGELENVLESALLVVGDNRLSALDLRLDRRANEPVTLLEVERRAIEDALRGEGGRVEAAAKRLGIPRSTLYHKLKMMGLAKREAKS